MKKILMVTAVIAFALSSCNKNQRAVKCLDGKWNVVSVEQTEGGVTETQTIEAGQSIVYDFDNCKLKKDEYCNLIVTTTGNFLGQTSTSTDNYTYKVIDKGETLVVRSSNGSSTTDEKLEIITLEKDKCSIANTNNSTKTTVNFEKM